MKPENYKIIRYLNFIVDKISRYLYNIKRKVPTYLEGRNEHLEYK